MAIVKTDDKHYMAIADSIRTNTGTENTYKPEEMAVGVNEVYEAGKQNATETVSDVIIDKIGSTPTGKNLIPYPYIETTKADNSFAIIDNGDGTLTVSGNYETTTIRAFLLADLSHIQAKAGDTFTISQGANNYEAFMQLECICEDGMMYNVEPMLGSETFTLPDDFVSFGICKLFVYNAPVTVDNFTFYPMLVKGGTAVDWEPYTDSIQLDMMPEKIDEVYKAGQSSMVDESKIIEKTVSGTNIVVIDDTSEIPHDVGCKVESVNLYHTDYSGGTSNGITVTRNADGSFSVSGTATNDVYIHLGHRSVDEGFTYYCSGGTPDVRLSYQLSDGIINNFNTITSKGGIVSTDGNLYGYSLKSINCVICASNGATVNEVVKPMVSLTETSDYTPYVDVSGVSVTRCGENLFPISNATFPQKVVGLTIDYDKTEQVYTINGTATGDQEVKLSNTPVLVVNGITNTLSRTILGGECSPMNGMSVFLNHRSTEGASYQESLYFGVESKSYTPTRNILCESQTFWILKDTTFTDFKFKVQLEIGSTATKHKPYNGQTVQANADGTVGGIKSLSPVMTLISDVEGVVLTVDYHKSWGKQVEWDALWDALQNGGARTNYYQFCRYGGWDDATFKPKYDMLPVESAQYMFYQCAKITDLSKDAIGVELDFSQCKDMRNVFSGMASLQKVGVIDTRSVTDKTYGLQAMFDWCNKLDSVEKFIVNEEQGFLNPFAYTYGLKEIRFGGVIGQSISFADSPLSKASIVNDDNSGIFNCLSDTASGKAVTLKLSAVQKAFETSSGANDGNISEEWLTLAATKSNWTITLA